jgi:hypothetical protein
MWDTDVDWQHALLAESSAPDTLQYRRRRILQSAGTMPLSTDGLFECAELRAQDWATTDVMVESSYINPRLLCQQGGPTALHADSAMVGYSNSNIIITPTSSGNSCLPATPELGSSTKVPKVPPQEPKKSTQSTPTELSVVQLDARMRNRAAAAKSRKKRSDHERQLRERKNALQESNNQLKAEIEKFTKECLRLRMILRMHENCELGSQMAVGNTLVDIASDC